MKGKAGLFVACSIGVCSGAAAAQLAAPPAGYKIEAKYTQKSPDARDNLGSTSWDPAVPRPPLPKAPACRLRACPARG
jgi:hypothetical protein